MKRSGWLLILALIFLPAGCGGTERGATPAPAVAPTVPDVAVTPVAAADPSAPLVGPLVGFYIEDLYEDVYPAIYDAGTGALRVLPGSVDDAPILLGEAQWFDRGCRLFIHGQLTDLNGVTQWGLPPTAQVDAHEISRLAPDSRRLAHVVPAGDGAEVEIVELVEPYGVTRTAPRGGADTRALAWSADGAWLYFTDRDEGGILQVYRATANGGTVEQITRHAASPGAIVALAPSPNGRYLAYGTRNLAQATHPYTWRAADEGWVGIVDLATGTSATVQPEKFGSVEPAQGIVWDAAGERLVFIGDSLPVGGDDPRAGRQVAWVTAAGEVTRTMVSADGPGGHVGWIAPLGGIDRLLVGVGDAFYIYEDGEFQPPAAGKAPLLGMEIGRRPIGIWPAPVDFPGEEACG